MLRDSQEQEGLTFRESGLAVEIEKVFHPNNSWCPKTRSEVRMHTLQTLHTCLLKIFSTHLCEKVGQQKFCLWGTESFSETNWKRTRIILTADKRFWTPVFQQQLQRSCVVGAVTSTAGQGRYNLSPLCFRKAPLEGRKSHTGGPCRGVRTYTGGPTTGVPTILFSPC